MSSIGGILRDHTATGDVSLIIESDSRNAINWVLEPKSAPWKLRSIILDIEQFKTHIHIWQIIHTLRDCNNVADGLARAGVYRTSDPLAFNRG
ncbi:hypothetical protein DITRI_Ditri01bG0150200 [Diplodiscus trichospermus]